MIPLAFFNISQNYDCNLLFHNEDSSLLREAITKEIYDPFLPKSTLNSWIDKSSGKIFTCNFIEQQEYFDRWIDLKLKFDSSFEQKKHLFPNISSNIIINDFLKSLKNILSFSPETISVGVSDDECVYIYFEKANKSVYFDLFFEPEQVTELSITVFENKVSKLSFTDYLDNSIHRFMNEIITENELSRSTFTAI